ncbi:inositol 2-dehydrogenase [Lachnospiraceae bacterium ZAX-1]
MGKNLRIGLLGAGRIGKLHATNIQNRIDGVEITMVADPFMNAAMRQWSKEIGIEVCTDNTDEVFTNAQVDAVFICSSTDTHADFIVKAARAGKHIFCEKPIHTDIEKIREALAVVAETGVKLQVGFVRRFDRSHKAVQETVASGILGKPHIIKVCSRDPEAPPLDYVKVSGGIFVDMMVHDFDMARFLSGSEITEVAAIGSCMICPDFAKYGDVDTAIVTLKFENGAIGVIDNSRQASYGYDQRVEVHCEKGCVQDDNHLLDAVKISTAKNVTTAKPTWFFLERYNDAFIAEVQEFVDAVVNDKEVSVGGKAGMMSVMAAMAAKKSLDEKRPVQLSELL